MTERRLNPDKLLQRVKKEEHQETRGKLKIYLGAAPGVGKTHEMLTDALEDKSRGLDVVIGVAESHGRKEIEAILSKFEILPKQTVDYHGKQLLEFDIDAALNRHPALILLDEMAHSNIPGLRHKKRWQDIKELLERGIDVYTTLNVQHIESLNKTVAQIIHAPIKETVPDFMLELADTIELVDIPPDALLKRLQEGKVYYPEQAALASDHFFRKGNLIALREIAFRIMANRVNTEVLLYRQDLGIKHIWPTKEKILVCVGSRPESLKLIRTAKRMADSLQAEWIAVYVDTPFIKSREDKKHRAIENLRLAEQLGAETKMLVGSDIIQELMNFAREENVTQIMIWKHVYKRWRDLIFRSLADEIVRNSGEIDVYIMTGTRVENLHQERKPITRKIFPWKTYAISIGIMCLATMINCLLYPYLNASNLIMVYLLGVTFVSLLGDMGASILASILSVTAYDFIFILPYHSFTLENIEYAFTLLVMLIVSLVISQLTLILHRQALNARLNEKQTSSLYKLSRKLSSTRGITNLLKVGIDCIADAFNSDVLALIPQQDHLVIQVRSKPKKGIGPSSLDEKEQGVAQWVYDMGEKAGLGTDSLSFSNSLYLPLLGTQGSIGVLKIYPADPDFLSSPDQIHLLETSVNQLAKALEVDSLQV